MGGGPSPGDVVFRLLCPNGRTGSIIGKGGDVIKHLRDETGARIKVEHAVPGAEERVIVISAPDTPEAEWSPSQRAVFHVYSRMMETTSTNAGGGDSVDGEDTNATTTTNSNDRAAAAHTSSSSSSHAHAPTVRLLVPSSQIGCLLGKGGAIINQMREESGAHIRVLPKEQLPPCAVEGDELVQISGEPGAMRQAFHGISAR